MIYELLFSFADPKYKRRREISAVFTRGVKAAQLIRTGVGAFIQKQDPKVGNRLRKLMLSVVHMDTTHTRDEIKILAENLSSVTGFNFNKAVSLRSIFNTRYTTTVNRATGKATINIPSFVPSERIKAPKGSTHFRVITAGFALDFEKNVHNGNTFMSDKLPWDDAATNEINIVLDFLVNKSLPIFIYFGLQFVQEVAGTSYSVGQTKLDPLCIVDVSIS